MILVIGGYKSFKKEYVKNTFNYVESDFSNNIDEKTKVLYDLNEINPENNEENINKLLAKEVVICDEIGGGIVPLEKKDREKRDNIGSICKILAKHATAVIRVYCGIAQIIKMDEIIINLTRHGKTYGNTLKRYIGITDEDLCEEGINELECKNENLQKVYVTSLKRTSQTAKIMYPNAEQEVIKDFSEMNFGDFENKNYKELSDNKDYSNWLDSFCMGDVPNGENCPDFIQRQKVAFESLVENLINSKEIMTTAVVHGGTIMALLSSFDKEKKSYFDYSSKCGQTWKLRININEWKEKKLLEAKIL